MTETNHPTERTKPRWKKAGIHPIFTVVLLLLGLLLPNLFPRVEVTHRRVADPRIPAELSGYRLAQVSDLHIRGGNEEILERLNKASPDLIVITGDLIDSNHPDLPAALTFVEAATAIAPVVFSSGNHEAWSGQYESLANDLKALGVTILDDQTMELGEGPSKIQVSGLRDPAFSLGRETTDYASGVISEVLDELPHDPDRFHILLAHRPEFLDDYAQSGVDLVLAGHAHGGQFRILNFGLYAPGQGFFPKYTGGLYRQGSTRMIVSRGLGNSVIPVRIFNPWELVIIELVHE